MKVSMTGVVKERTKRVGKDGVTRYTVVVEEQSAYPSPFAFSTKDPVPLGPPDGFAKVGATVHVTGYLNGKVEELDRRDGTGKWKKYSMWLSLASIGVCERSMSQASDFAPNESVEDDEMPF